MQTDKILDANRSIYQQEYVSGRNFLRYPADWVIRFHSEYLRKEIPNGRVLDYGCGSGNNSMFLIEQGYETYGVDVAEATLPLVKANLESKHLDLRLADRFSTISRETTELPFESGFFDFILSNQVLYYLGSEEQIKKVCKEFSRCLRPGGAVYFTMMGPRNYYITYHAKQIHNNGKVYEIRIDDPSHRLSGVHELIYLVRDTDELKDLFAEFECISTGLFDQGLFDAKSGFHWIFAGKRRP